MKAHTVFLVWLDFKVFKRKVIPSLISEASFFPLTILQGTAGGSCFEALLMGKLVCSDLDGGGPDFTGLLLALVIAVVLMMTCTPRPRRFVVAPYPVAFYRSGWQNVLGQTYSSVVILCFFLVFLCNPQRSTPTPNQPTQKKKKKE